jgi:hypothetical protein
LRPLSDNPIRKKEDDEFGFMPYVKILGDLTIEADSLPFTIGIFGEWGTGKTSLMYLLEKWLNEHDGNVKTVWFNPWKYDCKEELWSAFIQSIILKIEEESSGEIKEDVRKILKKLAGVAIRGVIEKSTFGIIDRQSINEIKEVISDNNKEHINFLNKFDEEFSDLVSKYVGNNGRLIIFIDDLDRCIPENAITILESLKLYLDNSNCIFILGMDRQIIELGINHRYGKESKITGHEYLEKIIQMPFYIPPIQFGKLRKSFQQATKAQEYTPKMWKMLQYGINGNPRKIKRFINSFYMVRKALESRTEHDRLSAGSKDPLQDIPKEIRLYYLAKLVIIQMMYPDFYDFLTYFPNGWKEIEEAVNKEQDEINRFIESYSNFRDILTNMDIIRFMKNTSYVVKDSSFPMPPDENVVKIMIEYTGLLEPAKSKSDRPSMGEPSTPTDSISGSTVTNQSGSPWETNLIK